ncbi:hypothetical protein BD410DRAFT_806328 [Rickenella mellea]|uniref:Dipeptidylpeptidase IV N-terminal domain-containing protein n=1 Tax=Rickenella mellea TaxID=50990 RepID=A0A4Y7PW04_9AGAM|nr:hypothetical protein BD410DRAFT_806328 [Rickenella mellea]
MLSWTPETGLEASKDLVSDISSSTPTSCGSRVFKEWKRSGASMLRPVSLRSDSCAKRSATRRATDSRNKQEELEFRPFRSTISKIQHSQVETLAKSPEKLVTRACSPLGTDPLAFKFCVVNQRDPRCGHMLNTFRQIITRWGISKDFKFLDCRILSTTWGITTSACVFSTFVAANLNWAFHPLDAEEISDMYCVDVQPLSFKSIDLRAGSLSQDDSGRILISALFWDAALANGDQPIPPSPWTPKNIASSESLGGLKISPDGSKVVYQVSPAQEGEKPPTSALWIADTAKAQSARQLTSGEFGDHSSVFHPDGERVVFLSDRHKGPPQLYTLRLGVGEAVPVLGNNNSKRGVGRFAISPDGGFIAFSSIDEPTEEDGRRKKERDDRKVFGDQKEFARLRLYSFSSGDVRTLNVSKDRHIQKILWKHDSKEVLFTTLRHNSAEFREDESYEPHRIADATAVFTHSIDSFSNAHHLYGESEDAASVVDLMADGLVAVAVAHGIDTRIDVIKGGNVQFILWNSDVGHEELFDWEAARLSDGSIVLIAIVSSGKNQQSPNVWAGRAESGQKVFLSTKLSTHYEWLGEAPIMTSIMKWKGSDGTDLEGIVTRPKWHNSSDPLPTILLCHGGNSCCTTIPHQPLIYSAQVLMPWPDKVYIDGNAWVTCLSSSIGTRCSLLVLNANYRGSFLRIVDIFTEFNVQMQVKVPSLHKPYEQMWAQWAGPTAKACSTRLLD